MTREAVPKVPENLAAHELGGPALDGLLPHVFMDHVTRYVLGNGPQRASSLRRVEDDARARSRGLQNCRTPPFHSLRT